MVTNTLLVWLCLNFNCFVQAEIFAKNQLSLSGSGQYLNHRTIKIQSTTNLQLIIIADRDYLIIAKTAGGSNIKFKLAEYEYLGEAKIRFKRDQFVTLEIRDHNCAVVLIGVKSLTAKISN